MPLGFVTIIPMTSLPLPGAHGHEPLYERRFLWRDVINGKSCHGYGLNEQSILSERDSRRRTSRWFVGLTVTIAVIGGQGVLNPALQDDIMLNCILPQFKPRRLMGK